MNSSLKSVNEISRDGILRGIVIDVNDPNLEGRIALNVPKFITKYDTSIKEKKSKKEFIEKENLLNPELKDFVRDDIENVNYIWFRPVFQNSFKVPYVGQTVFCFFEDGDPNKPYYFPFGPSLNGEVTSMDKVKATSDLFDHDKKHLIHVIQEGKDGSIIYFNENASNKRFEVAFSNNHSFSINENESENSIHFVTSNGNLLVLDELNKHITVKTSGGHIIKLDDQNKVCSLTTSGGHKINLDDGSGTVEISASSGGKIALGSGSGSGTVNIN